MVAVLERYIKFLLYSCKSLAIVATKEFTEGTI